MENAHRTFLGGLARRLVPPMEGDLVSPRRGLLIGALILCSFALYLHFFAEIRPANESIRIYFTQALVDHGSPSIDPVLEELHPGYKSLPAYQEGRWHPNIDAANFEGRDYMDKAPGLSLLVTPVYAVLSLVGLGGPLENWVLIGTLLTFFGVMIPSVLGIFAIRRIIGHLGGKPSAAWAGALIVGLATPYALYSTLFFGHTLAAALAAMSLLFAIEKRPATAGAMAGFMVLVDTPTALLAVFLGLATGRASGSFKDVVRFALGGLPFVLVQLLYNLWLFGDPLTFAYAFKVNTQFADIIGEGIYGFGFPSLEALWGLSFGGHRGLFFHAPILLIGALGFLFWRRRPEASPWTSALPLIALGYFLWIASFVDWPAGDSFGPRHLVPIIPLLGVGVGLLLSLDLKGAWHRVAKWAIPGLFLIGLMAAWVPAVTFAYAPVDLQAPLLELSLPMLFSGQVAPSLLGALGPEPVGLIVLVTLLVSVLTLVTPGSSAIDLRLLVRRAVLAGLFFAGIILALAPAPTERGLRARVNVATLLDQCEAAEDLCRDSAGVYIVRGDRCRCVWR